MHDASSMHFRAPAKSCLRVKVPLRLTRRERHCGARSAQAANLPPRTKETRQRAKFRPSDAFMSVKQKAPLGVNRTRLLGGNEQDVSLRFALLLDLDGVELEEVRDYLRLGRIWLQAVCRKNRLVVGNVRCTEVGRHQVLVVKVCK